MMGRRYLPAVLVLITDGAEELEFVTLIHGFGEDIVLLRAGFRVRTVGVDLDDTKTALCARGMRIKPQERSLRDLNPEYQDPHILVIPGGLGAWKLCRSPDALHYVHKCRNQDGWVAASCAGALVLKQAALTGMGRFSEKNRLTGPPEIRQEMIDGGWDFVDNERIVVDDRVITSAGPGASFELAFKIVELLGGSDGRGKVLRDQVAGLMMLPQPL